MVKILVVDDEKGVLDLLVRLLQMEGYSAVGTTSGKEGLELLRQDAEIGLIISDQRMPEMRGVEFLSRTREIAPDAVRILLTGYSDTQAIIDAINEGGASHYLTKPLDENLFLHTVRESVNRVEMTREHARLLETVKRQNEELRDWREQLESRVASQTAVIQEKNEELTEAYSRLQASQAVAFQQEKMAAIGQLAAGVAHEINNPIGFIASNLRTLGKYREKIGQYMETLHSLLEGGGDSGIRTRVAEKKRELKIDYILEDIGDLVKESLDGTEHMRQIVQGLKSFSHVDETESLSDLNECLENTIQVVWNEIKYKARLVRDFGDLPPIRCYPQKLKQVFMNLLVNASHSIQVEGEITVTTRCEGDAVTIVIADTGCGIAPEHLSRIFEPFFTTKKVGEGTGLGLSVVFEIINKHEGEIEVQSVPGEGTAFTISLPLK